MGDDRRSTVGVGVASLLYESPGGNQVDGLPPAFHRAGVISSWKSDTGAVAASSKNLGSATIGKKRKKMLRVKTF